MNTTHFRKKRQRIAGEKFHNGVKDGIVMRYFLQVKCGLPDLIRLGGHLPHVARIHAHFVKEKVIQPVEVLHVPEAFGKIRAKQRPELVFIGRINELHLVEAVEHFGGGNTQARRTAAGHELLN
jgi:hypothetical protein